MSLAGRTFLRVAVVAALAASSVGCTSTVRIPPRELPKLGRTPVAPKEWPVVRTFEHGDQAVCGPIESVGVEPVNGGVARLFPPFSARIEKDQLLVRDVLGPKSFRLDDVAAVSVDYENRKLPRVIIGATMITVGAPFFGVGAFMFGAGMSGGGELSGLAVLLGLTSMGIGAGIGVPGIYLAATDPSPPESGVARLRPTFRVGPGGASMSLDF